jgi:hypothetical protein
MKKSYALKIFSFLLRPQGGVPRLAEGGKYSPCVLYSPVAAGTVNPSILPFLGLLVQWSTAPPYNFIKKRRQRCKNNEDMKLEKDVTRRYIMM